MQTFENSCKKTQYSINTLYLLSTLFIFPRGRPCQQPAVEHCITRLVYGLTPAQNSLINDCICILDGKVVSGNTFALKGSRRRSPHFDGPTWAQMPDMSMVSCLKKSKPKNTCSRCGPCLNGGVREQSETERRDKVSVTSL